MEKVLELRQELKAKYDAVMKKYDEIGDREPTAEEFKFVSDLNKEIAEKTEKVKNLESFYGVKTDAQSFLKDWNTPANQLPNNVKEMEQDLQIRAAKNVVGSIVNHKQFGEWAKSGAHGKSPIVNLDGSLCIKSAITGASDTLGGAFVVTDRTNIYDDGTFAKQLGILDLINIGTTGSDLVEFVKKTTFTNNAASVAEGGTAAESVWAFVVASAAVEAIAHRVEVTRRALADAGQLATIVRNDLIYGLREKLNDLVLNGTGTTPQIRGILQTSGITAQAYDTSLLVTARKGRTKVRTQGRTTPNAFLFSPADNESFDLLMDGENRYYFGGPAALAMPTLWGLPRVEDETLADGTGLVANFKMATLWMREQSAIYVTDSDGTNFQKGIMSMLAEERAAFGVIRPKAFVTLDLTA